jgi:hypothetical protein
VNNWLACMTADAVIKAACNVDMDNIARCARGALQQAAEQIQMHICRCSPPHMAALLFHHGTGQLSCHMVTCITKHAS